MRRRRLFPVREYGELLAALAMTVFVAGAALMLYGAVALTFPAQ